MKDSPKTVRVVLHREFIKLIKKYAQENEMSRYEVVEQALDEFFTRAAEEERAAGQELQLAALDNVFVDALVVVMQAGVASASLLQRRLGIGYARAVRILYQLEEMGYVGPPDGSKPRPVNQKKLMKRKVN